MGQQQSRFSPSVGTKILLSVVSLLLLVIFALNATTIRILFEDKRTFTLQAQSTEASLAGKELANAVRGATGLLRIALGSVDPVKPLTEQGAQLRRFETMVRNQDGVLALTLGLLAAGDGSVTELARSVRAEEARALEHEDGTFSVAPVTAREIADELLRNGIALFNPTRVGGSPLLGVAIADLALKDRPEGVPVAFGFLSLKGFGRDIRASDLIIATLSGSVLFANRPELTLASTELQSDPLFVESVSSQVASGTKEYEAGGTQYLGSFLRSGLEFVVLTRTEWRRAMGAAFALIERFVLLGAMAVGLAIVFAIVFARTMTRPINRLYAATQEVSAGNFNLELKAESRDEIGALTESFVAMSRKITQMIDESVKQAHLEKEVAVASAVQQTLIPPPMFDSPLIQMRSLYQSASECGGDWWGFFGVGHRLSVMIADATGHGIPSALITASARSCFSVMHKLAQEEPEFGFSPGSMLAYANRVVHDAASGKIMMTFFVGVIDFDAGTLTYASAGHNPPWLMKKGDNGYTLKSLIAVGQRLGEARDVAPFEEKTVEIAVGDVLFLYTDGLTEGKNLEGEMFGKKRVRKIVEAKVGEGPQAVIDGLMGDFMPWNTGKALDDDVTLAVARIESIGPGSGS
jgi:serine phosphatase RsbU (regulator of sigma subunit)